MESLEWNRNVDLGNAEADPNATADLATVVSARLPSPRSGKLGNEALEQLSKHLGAMIGSNPTSTEFSAPSSIGLLGNPTNRAYRQDTLPCDGANTCPDISSHLATSLSSES